MLSSFCSTFSISLRVSTRPSLIFFLMNPANFPILPRCEYSLKFFNECLLSLQVDHNNYCVLTNNVTSCISSGTVVGVVVADGRSGCGGTST